LLAALAQNNKEIVVKNPRVPQQANAFDCGIFTCLNAFTMAYGLAWTYKAEHMNNYRHYIRLCLTEARLYTPPITIKTWRPPDRKGANIAVAHFHHHVGAGAPRVETEMALEIATWRLHPAPVAIQAALKPAYRARQLRSLERLRDAAVEAEPTTTLMQLACNLVRGHPNPGTAMNFAATLAGALGRLDQYASRAPISLQDQSQWRDLLRLLDIRKKSGTPTVKPHLTPASMKVALDRCPQQWRALLALTWAHAARIENVFDLRPEEILLEADHSRIVWKRAKTVAKAGQYTTTASTPEPILKDLRLLLQSLPRGQAIVPDERKAEVSSAWRRSVRDATTPEHDLRALRRGALTAMALRGTPLPEVMLVSGHKNLQSLIGYLGQGLFDMASAQTSRLATRALW